jgi:ElaB/YqjD/DUF883 family membrane-anchored ribosome-binding protein
MVEAVYPKSQMSDPSVTSGSNFVDRLAQSAHKVVDEAAEKAKPAVDKLQSSSDAARTALVEKAETAAALSEDVFNSVRNYVRERPLTVLTGAVAVGVLLASLSRSR